MSKNKLSDEQRHEITAILRENGAIVGYLFGSYVRGTAGPLSDIDIGVAFPKQMDKASQEGGVENIRARLENIFGRDKVDIENVPMIKSPLLRYIVTLGEGEILFSDNQDTRNALADMARREYEDTAHLRNIQRQALPGLFA